MKSAYDHDRGHEHGDTAIHGDPSGAGGDLHHDAR